MKKGFWFLTFIVIFGCSSDDNIEVEVDNQMEDPEEIPSSENNVTAIVPCENGMAGIYPCNGYDLVAHISLSEMSAQEGNDIWGWTDAESGKEYALIGLDNGTAFIDISDAVKPIFLGKLPTATSSSPWRDVKIFGDFAYIVSEASDHGVQVFDLKKLRNVSNIPKEFSADGRYTDLGNAHNIVINETSGFAYPVGTNRDDQFNGGVHFLNLENPIVPALAGGWGLNGYTHDAQVITYNGPDANYLGSEIFEVLELQLLRLNKKL